MIQESSSTTTTSFDSSVQNTPVSSTIDENQLIADIFTMEEYHPDYNPQPQFQQYSLFQHNNNGTFQLLGSATSCFQGSLKSNDCEPMSSTDHSNQDGATSDVNNTSDATEVRVNTSIMIDDGNNVECILPNEEPFTYLQGLNSGNLMQFSQESVIQELMAKEQVAVKTEQVEIKPNLDVLPTFEEHDFGGYKFKLNPISQRKSRSSILYSESLNKVYLRMNDIFSIDAAYTPKMPRQQLRIRVLMCFVKEVSEPVLRCQNHISKDTEAHSELRHCLLRCENPSAVHCGMADGKNINDRYSVLIPLVGRVTPQKDNSIKQTIALKFTCQNSCIGRKETSLIFLLESMNGEILSQRVLDVKVCSCPKRDLKLEERNSEAGTSTKRKMNENIFSSEPKIRKLDTTMPGRLKTERNNSDLEENDDDCNSQKQYDVQRTPSGGFRIVMEVCTKDLAMKVIDFANQAVAQNVVNEPNHSMPYLRNFRRLKRLLEKGRKL